MRNRLVLITVVSALVFGADRATAQRQPPKTPRRVVAVVNGDPITLGQLLLQIERPEDAARVRKGRATEADLKLLDRLITVRLIVQEAGRMGISELPEIRRQVDVTSRSILREVLMGSLVKRVAADEAAIETAFKDLAREWKTASLLFPDEQAATQAREEIERGTGFDAVSARVVADKLANTEGDDSYHRRKDYLPEIAAEVVKLQPGETSPVIRIPAGFVVVHVVDVRCPESADARAEAESAATTEKQKSALDAAEQALRAKYVVVHQDVVDSLDFEAPEPGLDALLKDKRVVAEIKGADPVTVADLTEYLKLQFFHGGDDAAQAKRMNARKQAALDATLGRRVLNLEAARRGIARTEEYRDRVRAFEDALVLETFVQKVIAPDNKMREQEVRSYYDEHTAAYSYPGMVRLRSLAFRTRASAEDAIEKLRGGADYTWLVANADDLVPTDARALPIPDGQVVMIESLPDGVQKALASPKAGDVRLFVHPEGQFYVLSVSDVVPPSPRPYDEVRQEIARKLYSEKLTAAVEAYAARLRAMATVVIHLRKAD